MKKLYSMLLLSLISLTASAWSYDIPKNNAVLAGDGYALYKLYDFYNGITNDSLYFTDANGERVYGDGCLTQSPDKASVKINGFDSYQVISPVEMNNFFLQIGTAQINLRAGVNKDGLHNYGSGSRFFAIANVKAGQIIICQWGLADASRTGNVVQPASAISGADPCTFTDITEEIHARQIEEGTYIDEEGHYAEGHEGDESYVVYDTIPGTADAFNYWRAESDGYFVVEMQRGTAIQGMQIWVDASAGEAVSSPTYKIYSVDGDSRQISLTPGESTIGSQTTAWYGLEDGDQDDNGNIFALYLVDTDEIVGYDYVYGLDADSNQVVVDSIVIYKQIISPEDAAAGVYGQIMYDGTPIEVSPENDLNGDGYVDIITASVSEYGNFSESVTFRIAVNEIQLNAPVLTLTGLEGEERSYTVSWDNNTLCGEDYVLTATVDGDEKEYYNGEGFDLTYTALETIGMKISAQGYVDGETSQEVLNPGVIYARKNAENAAAGAHDWDFVHLSAEQYQMLTGTYSDTIAYIRPNSEDSEVMDTTLYTRDEFYALVEAGTLTEADGTAWNPINCGWTYDAGRGRGTLNVIEGGNDQNSNGYGYAEDGMHIFNNGLSASCPPNTKNNSCVLVYNNNDLGVYFMSRPTLTFTREAAQYGEYVLIYQGAGGSNYTNRRWPSLHEVPADELLTVTLNSGGIHVFYIDVYTTEELPADGVESVESAVRPNDNKIYDIAGRQVTKMTKGLYIINGKKVLVK